MSKNQDRNEAVAELIDYGRECAKRLSSITHNGTGPPRGSFTARMESQSAKWESAHRRDFDGRGVDVDALRQYASDVERCAEVLMSNSDYQIYRNPDDMRDPHWGDRCLAEQAQQAADAVTEHLDYVEPRELKGGKYLNVRRF